MKKLIFLIIPLVIFGFYFAKEVKAGVDDNVSGWAWAENVGWISFNCTNLGTCGIKNYGVNIDPSTGNFSGYAWSDKIGWIKFGPPLKINTENYPICPPTTCPSGSPNYPAKLDSATGKITGWARACAGTVNGDCNSPTRTDGWDGWILMGPIVKGATDYGVWIDSSVTPSEFRSFAWGSDVVGWISFNCSNQGVCTSSTAEGGPSNYKVVTSYQPSNTAPTVSNAQITATDYCTETGDSNSVQKGQVSLSWTYKDSEGDDQEKYWIQVATDSSFTNRIIDCQVPNSITAEPNQDVTITSALIVVSPNSSEYNNRCQNGDELTIGKYLAVQYNGTYFWRVRSKAASGNTNWSDWTIYGDSFTTPVHAYPWIDFSWTPQRPTVNENVTFTDQSVIYGGATKSSLLWTFQDGVPSTATTPTTTVKFTAIEGGGNEVTLQVKDNTSPAAGGPYLCTGSRKVNITFPLPQWKEIPPILWLRKFLAAIGGKFLSLN